jgi:hypothetical protein
MLKNSLKYYWEDPERITTVPLSTLDELLQVYPWSNVLRFLYWKRWLIEKTSGNLETDSTDILPLYGELRYMLENGPTEYGNEHFVALQDTESTIGTKFTQDEEDASVSEEMAITSVDDNIEEEKEIHQIEENQSPEIEAPLLPEELPAEAITDEIVQEFDAFESDTEPFVKAHQADDHKNADEDISEENEKLSSEFNFVPDHQTEDEDSIEESGEDLSDEQELIEENVEVNIEDETTYDPSFSPDMHIESPEEEQLVDDIKFEKELKELEEAFLTEYESVIQKLDEDIAKLNELQQQEKYDEMLHEDHKTEIDKLIESSIIEKEEIKQVEIEKPVIQLEKSTPQESNTVAGKNRPMRNLQFDEEVSGFTQWLLHLTNKKKNEEKPIDIEPQEEEVEDSIAVEVHTDPSQFQENEDIEYLETEEEEADEDLWTSDEEPQEELKAKKKKGKSKKKDKKKKKKKRKKGSKVPEEEIDIGIVSEPLAKLFAAQGAIDEAISMYEKLILYRPEKKSKFAARIKKLKQIQKN